MEILAIFLCVGEGWVSGVRKRYLRRRRRKRCLRTVDVDLGAGVDKIRWKSPFFVYFGGCGRRIWSWR